METALRCVKGGHTHREIRWHLAFLAVGYWGLVFFAWWGYPEEQHYSIMEDTLSALGSFDERHNPQWFWLFSVAMIYCGLAMMPIILYIRRGMASISTRGANIGALFFLAGCLAIVLTGAFPYGRGEIIGDWQWRHIHERVAVSIAVTFALGAIWHAAILFHDRLTRKTLADTGKWTYLKVFGPFFICVPIFIAATSKIRWASVVDAFHAVLGADLAVGQVHLDAAVHGLRSFPLLEHLAIWALTLYVIWFAAVVPQQTEVSPIPNASSDAGNNA